MQRAELAWYLTLQLVTIEADADEAAAVRQRRWDPPLDGVVAQIQSLEVVEVTELRWQDAVEAVRREAEVPQVGEVAQRGGDGAGEVELAEPQLHDAAAAAAPEAAPHAAPPAHRNGQVAPRREGPRRVAPYERSEGDEREPVGVAAARGGDRRRHRHHGTCRGCEEDEGEQERRPAEKQHC